MEARCPTCKNPMDTSSGVCPRCGQQVIWQLDSKGRLFPRSVGDPVPPAPPVPVGMTVAEPSASTVTASQAGSESETLPPPSKDNFTAKAVGLFVLIFVIGIVIGVLEEILGEESVEALDALGNLAGMGIGILLAVMFYNVAKDHRFDVLKDSNLDLTATDRNSPRSWALMVFFFGLIAIPVYLVKRNKLKEAAYRTITENLFMNPEQVAAYKRKRRLQSLRNFGILILILVFFGFLLYLILKEGPA